MAIKKELIIRLLLLGIIMISLILLAKFTPIGLYFSVEKLQILINDAGNWGFFIFFALFLMGTLMNVPGAVFLIFAILTYDYFLGILISYITALSCAMINFLFARFVGGKGLSEIKNKRIQKALSKVETHPISTLFWLRLFLLLSPVINYALALTKIKFKDFFIGNVIAMILPFVFIISGTVFFRSAFFHEVILAWLQSVFS